MNVNPARLLTDARKGLTALTGGAAVAVSAGLLSGTPERWVTGTLAVATAVLVLLVPNRTPAPDEPT